MLVKGNQPAGRGNTIRGGDLALPGTAGQEANPISSGIGWLRGLAVYLEADWLEIFRAAGFFSYPPLVSGSRLGPQSRFGVPARR